MIEANCPRLTPLVDNTFAATTLKLAEVAGQYNKCREASLKRLKSKAYRVDVYEDYVLDYKNVKHEEPISQCVEALNEQRDICKEPIKPEFKIENMLVTVFYYDTVQAFQEEVGDPDTKGWSVCETKPDKNIAYCDFYVVMPEFVDDDFTMTFGHESLHGLFGDYHAAPISE